MNRLAPGSLRLRLLTATVVTLALALAGAQVWLAGLFRDEVLRQLDSALVRQIDQLSARLDLDTAGQPRIDPAGLSDPRWDQPYSGLYWQIDRLGVDGSRLPGVLRARSLWDTQLLLPADTQADGALHWHDTTGPQGQVLRVVERALVLPEQPQTRWRLMVAADLGETQGATKRFSGVLAASLAGLGLLLALAALAQVAVGLAPLKALQRALERLRDGRSSRLDGRFPAELQPLVQDFNGVLDRNDAVLARARTQAGNLAHALKTPLAVLGNAATAAPPGPLAQAVTEFAAGGRAVYLVSQSNPPPASLLPVGYRATLILERQWVSSLIGQTRAPYPPPYWEFAMPVHLFALEKASASP